MSRPLPENIARIAPYVPGRCEDQITPLLSGRAPVKLASNENPLGPSPRAVLAARETLARSHRYPEGSGLILREALAARHRLPAGQILFGNGSTELVEILARTFLGQEGEAVMSQQSFIMYRIAVMTVNGRVVEVPLREKRHDVAALSAACGPRTALVYIANPNNLTGNYLSKAELEAYFRRIPPGVITVLDEAYTEYVEQPDYPDGLEFLRRGERVVVLRTFSKIHGLAGLRIGYGIGPVDLVEGMGRVRSPFNTNRVGQAAAIAALEDREHLDHSRRVNREGREFLERELNLRGIAFIPSVANFVLLDVEQDAENVYQALLCEGVIVRPMGAYRLPTSLRVTVGLPAELDRFLEVLDRIPGLPHRAHSC